MNKLIELDEYPIKAILKRLLQDKTTKQNIMWANIQNETQIETTVSPIIFPDNKEWTDYVDSRRLEITCGEAPFLISRYDASTGELIPIKERIGILARKLRVVNENTKTEAEWFKWAIRALQSVYGYEYQGDSLLIARANMIYTFSEYLFEHWHRDATQQEL